MEPLPQPTLEPPRRLRLFANVFISACALAAAVFLINYLSARHFQTWSVAAGSRPELSTLTRRVLGMLTNELNVAVIYDRKEPLYGAIKDWLDEFARQSSRVHVEYVDTLYPSRVLAAERKFKLEEETRPNRIVFEAAGRKRIVYESELTEFDYPALLRRAEFKRKSFRGEQLFSSAIYTVIDPQPVKAYFLKGHHEHDPASKADASGFLRFARLLSDNNIAWSPLIELSQGVPKDCRLLIIAGATDDLRSEEQDQLEEYLSQGGRLLFLCSSNEATPKRFAQLLEKWGVEVGDENMMDMNPDHNVGGEPFFLSVSSFADHPIVKSLHDRVVFMPLTKPVRQGRVRSTGADAPKVTEIAFINPESKPAVGSSDSRGVPVMAAVERGAIKDIADRGSTRIVVAGSSYFLGNMPIDQAANLDFAGYAVNWLLNREILLEGIPSHPIRGYRVTLSPRQMGAVRWLFLGVMPGVALGLSLVTWLRRRA